MFCSNIADKAIAAYQKKSTIVGVPVDDRKAAQAVFLWYMRSDDTIPRRPIVLNMGTKGTGKSVV